MRILAIDAARAIGGELLVNAPESVDAGSATANASFDGANFDSRILASGQLFVALVAERDGHDFVDSAVSAGAGALMVSTRVDSPDVAVPQIVVDDTAAGLMELARWARRRLDVPVIGVTGSVGKTSTKDMIAAAVGASRSVWANRASFNNEQGLPVTILNAPDDVEVLVLEMGMRGLGEITRLCDVAEPSIGVVTRVAASHTERVGGIDGVAVAKQELVQALPSDGVAVLNGDDDRVAAMASATDAKVVTFGRGAAVDVMIQQLELDAAARPRFVARTPWGNAEVQLAVSGEHMADNAAAALAVAGVLDGRIDRAVEALSTATISSGRMQVSITSSGGIVIDDAYNANPDSTRAAITALVSMNAQRRIAVLGPMAELDDPERGHREVAEFARSRGVEVIAVGTGLYGVSPSVDTVADIDAAVDAVGRVDDGIAVLVKASNSAALWRVAERLRVID